MAKPVVAADVGGVHEAITHGETGYLVPPRDAKALARAISAVLADPEGAKAMGRAARERAARDFNVDRMVQDTEIMYEKLLAAAGGRGR